MEERSSRGLHPRLSCVTPGVGWDAMGRDIPLHPPYLPPPHWCHSRTGSQTGGMLRNEGWVLSDEPWAG